MKWDGSIVGAEIHQVDNQQYIQQKHDDYLCFPEPEELIGDEKYEGGYYFGCIKFDGRE